MQSPSSPVLAALLVVAVIVIFLLWLRYEKLLQDYEQRVKEASRKSVERSRSTLKGQIAEQIAPLLPGFSYSAADARFLGDPVDYVVFDGRTDFHSEASDETPLEIVLLEIKQGQSKLSAIQRAIAAAVEAGRVRFEVSQVGEDGRVTTITWRSRRPG